MKAGSVRGVSRWAVVLLAVAGPAAGVDSEITRRSLKGLGGVGVLVEVLNAELERDGLQKEAIQTDVELKLRLAGIRVPSRAESVRAPGDSFLSVMVNATRIDSLSLYPYSVDVELYQRVLLERDRTASLAAATWSVGGVSAVGRLRVQDIRGAIKDYVDDFINAYLSVNPR